MPLEFLTSLSMLHVVLKMEPPEYSAKRGTSEAATRKTNQDSLCLVVTVGDELVNTQTDKRSALPIADNSGRQRVLVRFSCAVSSPINTDGAASQAS